MYISKQLFVHYCCIINYREKLILKVSSSWIIGSSAASYENGILFHWIKQSLILISISKPVDICFAILQQFSKPGNLNSLKNSNNSLICFTAMSMLHFYFLKKYNFVANKVICLSMGSVCPWLQAKEFIFLQMPQGWALETDGKAPITGVPTLPSGRFPPRSWAMAIAATTAAASTTFTAIEFSHSNLETFESMGSTISNYTGATDVNWAHPGQPGTKG